MARVQAWFDAQEGLVPNGAQLPAPVRTADERHVAAVGSR
jgi:hypothetical protein